MNKIVVSAPCKVHLLGEHSVVYGKPAVLTSVNLRVYTTISSPSTVIPSKGPHFQWGGIQLTISLRAVIEPIIKKYLKLKILPPYQATIASDAPIGSGLGTSAAVSASYIAALLTFLKVNWDLNLIYNLTYEAEKVFHGNPSGADSATVIFGGLIWFRKESTDLKIIQPLPFTIPPKLTKNFIFINTGKPKEITAEMVKKVSDLYQKNPKIVERFLSLQEKLTKQLLPVIKTGNQKEFLRIIKEGEANLETIGVCSPEVKKIIRQIEAAGGAAKICGAGATTGPTGVLLAYHQDKKKLLSLVRSFNLPYFTTKLGVEGLRIE